MAGRTSDIMRMTESGVKIVFNKAVKTPKKKYYPNCVQEIPSQQRMEKYDTIGDIGQAYEKLEGDSFKYDNYVQGYETRIVARTFGQALQLTKEEIFDDLYKTTQSRYGTGLVNSLITLKEKLVAGLYNGAFSGSTADGQPAASASHPLLRDPTKVNDNLASGALTVDNFIDAKNKFNSIYNQAGDFMDTEPTHLLIHPNKLYVAIALLESQLLAFELSNTKNMVNDVMPIRVIVNKYLDYNHSTKVSPWFLIDKTLTDAGMILQNRQNVVLKTWWEEDDLTMKGTVHERYNVGVISPGYGFVGSPGS